MVHIKIKAYILLYANFLFLSFSSVLAKLASQFPLKSFNAMILYCSAFLILGVYAILWQQVLKRIPLTVAYPNRSITVILGLLWGALIFNELISWNMIVGALIIVCGIILLVPQNE